MKKTKLIVMQNDATEQLIATYERVVKAKNIEVTAYQKALESYGAMEELGMIPPHEVKYQGDGDYTDMIGSVVDQYAPGMAKGAIKKWLSKNKAMINAEGDKFLAKQIENMKKTQEEAGKPELTRAERELGV